MSHDTAALDCLFGPYDFLDTAQQPPPMPAPEVMLPPLEQQQQHLPHPMSQAYRGMTSLTRLSTPQSAYEQQYNPHHVSTMGGHPQQGQVGQGVVVVPESQQTHQAQLRSISVLQHDEHSQRNCPPPGLLQPAVQQAMQQDPHLHPQSTMLTSIPQASGYRRTMIPHKEEPVAKRGRFADRTADDHLQDKADRCRARNREHARQTRRRKKEFVENLQSSVQQLSRENEALKAKLAQNECVSFDRRQRYESVAAIMALRVSGEDDPEQLGALWARYVEPDFELHLPRTPYRSFPTYELTSEGGRIVSGVPAAILDLKSLRVCLTSLLRRLKQRRAGYLACGGRDLTSVSSMAWREISEPSDSILQQKDAVNVVRNCQNKLIVNPNTQIQDDPAAQTSSDDADRSEVSLRPNSSSDEDSPPDSSVSGSPDQQINNRRLSDPSKFAGAKQKKQPVTECFLERQAVAWTEDGTMLAPWVLRLTDEEGHIVFRHRGTLRATFRSSSRSDDVNGTAKKMNSAIDKSHRIAKLEIIHDTFAMWQQLQRGNRVDKSTNRPVPNTLDSALEPSKEARIVTTATRPFRIEHVNGAWTKLCGYEADESIGKTLSILQGPDTEKDQVQHIVRDAEHGHASCCVLTNYNKDGHKFRNFLRVYPLFEDDDGCSSKPPSHMLGVLQHDICG